MDPEVLTPLVRRASAGDVHSFGLLIRAIEPRLRGYVVRIIGTRPFVDDVLQETFVRLWRGLAWLREPSLFRAWSYRIATREAQRALGRERKRELRHADASALEGLAAIAADPTVRLELEARLPEISRQARIAIVAHYFEGLSLEDVAAATSAPLGTVKSRLASGLMQLRALLGSSR